MCCLFLLESLTDLPSLFPCCSVLPPFPYTASRCSILLLSLCFSIACPTSFSSILHHESPSSSFSASPHSIFFYSHLLLLLLFFFDLDLFLHSLWDPLPNIVTPLIFLVRTMRITIPNLRSIAILAHFEIPWMPGPRRSF